jgi:hypothetical protein
MASGSDEAASRKRARVAPDYVMIIAHGPQGRLSEPHWLTERCDCMPGVRVPDDVGYDCSGPRRAQYWRYLQGYCSKGGRFRDGCEPASASGSVAFGCGAMQRSEGKLRTDVLRPCKYHTEVLALFRSYIVASETSVQSRRTLQHEVDTLNQGIKDGLAEHVSRDEYAPIAHRNEWEDGTGESESESESERQVRELADELWDARMEIAELRRGPPTRDAETQTDF